MATDETKLNFDSRLNYMKRSEFTGSTSVTLGAAGATTTHTVTHSLGYIPFFIVGANLNDTSTIWSNNRVHEYTQSSNSGGARPVQLFAWINDTDLTIEVINGTGGLEQSGGRTVYWSIYLDYNT